VAGRFFPSSKLCSACGVVQEEMPLSVRSWTCPACHATHDRDLNAATNLARYAVSSTVSACGGEGSGSGYLLTVKPVRTMAQWGAARSRPQQHRSAATGREDLPRSGQQLSRYPQPVPGTRDGRRKTPPASTAGPQAVLLS
jgi:hypothetical protein